MNYLIALQAMAFRSLQTQTQIPNRFFTKRTRPAALHTDRVTGQRCSGAETINRFDALFCVVPGFFRGSYVGENTELQIVDAG